MWLVTGMRLLSAGLLLLALVLPGCATLDLHARPAVTAYPATAGEPGTDAATDGRLRIMTLNVAHGRGDSFHQLLQSSVTTLANLDSIATLLRDSGSHVVALQEADGPSFWSGNFNHIDYLAHNGAFHQSVQGLHVDGLGLAYGTALVARLDLRNPQAITFDPMLSPVPKGFVVSTIDWPGKPGTEVDIVSVHLDFASEATRRKQAAELVATLRDRQRPVIIMGDFNSVWRENSSVQHISQELGVAAYRPEAADLETFPAFGERLDWILVSPGIAFRSYTVIPDTVSDHRGVMAELELEPGSATAIARLADPGDRTPLRR
jgi:endonuclease/exonuclease/phosphatase family metal-dependent hydrolase